MAIAAEDADNIRRQLECDICLERQTRPRQLPCIHTFCEKCVQKIIEKRLVTKNGTLACPRCNRVIPIPENGATGFPLNCFLNNLNDCVPKTGNVFCHVCGLKGVEVEAESICVQCVHYLCKKCSDIHCETGITFEHEVVSLKEAADGQHFETIRRNQKACCPKHPEESIKVYCEQCKTPACLICSVVDHGQHKIESVEKTAEHELGVIRPLIALWEEAVGYAQLLSTEKKKVLDELSPDMLAKKVEEIGKTFDDYKEKIVAEVQTKKVESITELNDQFTSARKGAQAAYDQAEIERESLASTLGYVKKLVEKAHPAETTQQFPMLEETLGSLDIRQLQATVDKPTLILSPSELPMPDLSFKTTVKMDSHHISTDFWKLQMLSKSSGRHDVTSQEEEGEGPVLVSRFSSRLPDESVSGCWGLSLGVHGYMVADRANKCVKVFDINTSWFKPGFKFALRDGLQTPRDVTSNSKGEIFVTDCDIHGVVKYGATGRLVKEYPGMVRDWGSITCWDDQLIISDTLGGRVLFTNFDCVPRHQIDTKSLEIHHFKPRYLCVDPTTGHLVIRQYHPSDVWYTIDWTNSPKKIVNTYRDQLNDPYGVCVDDFGNILVADRGSNQVILHNETGARVLLSREHVNLPTGMCISAPGHVSVVEYSSGEVKTFRYMDVSSGE